MAERHSASTHTRAGQASTTPTETTAGNRWPHLTSRGYLYPLVPGFLMAVWSDSKVLERQHMFGRPCSLWHRREIYDRGNNGRWILVGLSVTAEVDIRIMNIPVAVAGSLCLPPCLRACQHVQLTAHSQQWIAMFQHMSVRTSRRQLTHRRVWHRDRDMERHRSFARPVHGTIVCTSRLLDHSASTAVENLRAAYTFAGNRLHSVVAPCYCRVQRLLCISLYLCTTPLQVHVPIRCLRTPFR